MAKCSVSRRLSYVHVPKDGKDGQNGQPGKDGENGKDAVYYSIELSPPSVTVNALLGTVYPQSVTATAYRHEAGEKTAMTDGQITFCYDHILVGGGFQDTATINTDAVLNYNSAWFEFRLQGQRLARQPLMICRVGQTYKPMRIRMWSDIPDSSTLYPGFNDSDPWTDIVMYLSGNTVSYYRCEKQCTKAASSVPSSAAYQGYLQPASDFGFVATQILLAQNAVINMLQGNRITVTDQYGNPTTGMQAQDGGVHIWAGHINPALAPFRVLSNGAIVATSADISGRIAASSMDLKISTAEEGEVPNGSICFDTSEIKLPELQPGNTRVIKVVNPGRTRSGQHNLSLVPQSSSVLIADGLDWQEATSATRTLPTCGANGECYIELLGLYREGTGTVWLTVTISKQEQ